MDNEINLLAKINIFIITTKSNMLKMLKEKPGVYILENPPPGEKKSAGVLKRYGPSPRQSNIYPFSSAELTSTQHRVRSTYGGRGSVTIIGQRYSTCSMGHFSVAGK